MSDKCFYCDKPAERYCDFRIGFPIKGYERVGAVSEGRFRAVTGMDVMPYTCDMPLCLDHKKQIGTFHVSGKDSFTETIDHCPEHAGQADNKSQCCTEDEAHQIRRAIKAQARRKSLVII